VAAASPVPSSEGVCVGCRDQSSCRLLLQSAAVEEGAVAIVIFGKETNAKSE
jgi:hypothetical protein